MKYFYVTFKPDGKQVAANADVTITEAAAKAGIILNSVCGGRGICKKCIVNLEPDGRQVLACQHRIESNLTITIPTCSRFFEQKILAEGVETKAEFEPDIYKKYLKNAKAGRIFGVAVDIGTTTVVAKLINMKDGKCLATQATINP